MVVSVGGTAGASLDHHQARIHDHAGNTGTLTYVGSGAGNGEERALRILTERGRPVAT